VGDLVSLCPLPQEAHSHRDIKRKVLTDKRDACGGGYVLTIYTAKFMLRKPHYYEHRYPKLSISGFESTVNVWDLPYWSNFENIEIKSTFKLN
jgi:hypothetical protein